ncbi:hypothetical protein RGQ29_022540 [Quercus rubra]|uniref:Uncharacterized protein n=1 Tax=Quercus rubra TaxID=3512 RepID=A0AAN7F437_QUERU|nr:hypothetical protein RGQ29_022540 [Quercus rubra]
MNREQKRRRFNEALVNMLYPQPPPPPSSCSASDGNDDSESGTQKLTRAQRKRLRKKKLKEDASRRGKMIGPLLPSTKENVASNEQPACANLKKGKHRRMAKRLAKERCKIANVEHCDPK